MVLSSGGLVVGDDKQDLIFSIDTDTDTVIIGNPSAGAEPVLSVDTDTKILQLNGKAIITGKVGEASVETSRVETTRLEATTITAPTSIAEQSSISGFRTISGTTISGTTISGGTINGTTIYTDEISLGDFGNIQTYTGEDKELKLAKIEGIEQISGSTMKCTNLTATNADICKLTVQTPANSGSTETFVIKNALKQARLTVNAEAQSTTDPLMTLHDRGGNAKIYFRPDNTSIAAGTNGMLEVNGCTKTDALFIGSTNVSTKLSSIEDRLSNLGFKTASITVLDSSYIDAGNSEIYSLGKIVYGKIEIKAPTVGASAAALDKDIARITGCQFPNKDIPIGEIKQRVATGGGYTVYSTATFTLKTNGTIHVARPMRQGNAGGSQISTTAYVCFDNLNSKNFTQIATATA